tara:strand:- start:227 stop:370 length:144 start_codon:yes stop_codon:yes gene_type:complete
MKNRALDTQFKNFFLNGRALTVFAVAGFVCLPLLLFYFNIPGWYWRG